MPARILIILPREVDRLLYEEALPTPGFQVASVSSIGEALESIHRHPPDVLMLDEQVCLADGGDPIPVLRAACSAPIALCAWCSTERSRLLALERGADDALPKPPERLTLAATVRSLYQQKQQMDRQLDRATQLSEHLDTLTGQVNGTIRSLRSSLCSAVLSIGFIQEILGEQAGIGALAQALADASGALDAASHKLDELQAAVRTDLVARQLEVASIDLTELLGQVSASRRSHAEARRVELGVEAPHGVELDGDRAVLTRMAHHLVDASLSQTSAGGRVLLSVEPGAEAIEIAVRCSGRPGALVIGEFSERPTLPVEGVPGPRDPGLEFCRQAVRAHGGSMRVEHSPDWPVSYVVRLPRQAEAMLLGSGEGRSPG